IFRSLLPLLRQHLESRRDKGQALFTGLQGRLKKRRIQELFRFYATEADLPPDRRHVHVLRHSAAVHVLDAGEDIDFAREGEQDNGVSPRPPTGPGSGGRCTGSPRDTAPREVPETSRQISLGARGSADMAREQSGILKAQKLPRATAQERRWAAIHEAG